MIADYDVDDGGGRSIDGISGWTPQQVIVVMKCTNNAATNAQLIPLPDDSKQN